MGKRVGTSEWLSRWWREIKIQVQDAGGGGGSRANRLRLQNLKNSWFKKAFRWLKDLPYDEHIWCGHSEVMRPFLGTFCNFSSDSPLKLLWDRISSELQHCAHCVCTYHGVKEACAAEYEEPSIGPLLRVLQSLDEERICDSLKDINAKFSCAGYDPAYDSSAVSVLFEVLTFPVLLDDRLLASEFETFIEAVDNRHELSLFGHHQYPGVYALLFLKSRRARSIGYRLAGHMGKLRSSEDLDILQPLLKKCIYFLETELMPQATEFTRPRVTVKQGTVWLGIKALLGFLEPQVFEKGILEPYPSLMDAVLNTASTDSAQSSDAVYCLAWVLKMLGCRIWLRSTLSPDVMRMKLLEKCWDTRNEKSQKDVFDLFQPFLQSLEALQDGEYRDQLRRILEFLHEVTVSDIFSSRMKRKARQVARDISNHKSRALFSEEMLNRQVENNEPFLDKEPEVPLMCPEKVGGKDETGVIIIDDDDEPAVPATEPSKSFFAKPFQPGPKRRVIQLNSPAQNRFWKVNSETRRFKPPRLDDWYKAILELDYFVTVGLASAEKYGDGNSCKLKEVPASFKSPDEYIQVFQPLVLEEFKAQLHNSFLEMTSIDTMNCGVFSVLSVERIDGFHLVRCVYDESNPSASKRFSENDLILLTRQPLTSSYDDVHMVGKVERHEFWMNTLVIRLYLKYGCHRLNKAQMSLVDQSKWCISHLMSIAPQLREFQVLSSLREIPLLPVILDPSTGHSDYNTNEILNEMPQPLQQVLKSSYNDVQLEAIYAACGSSDLTLIQGPPGTGKTRTILAIVSGLLALSQMRTEKRSSTSCDPRGATTPGIHSKSKGRVLICAQSNAAVDELVSRISTEGLYDCEGLKYKPHLVRVGNPKTIHSTAMPFYIGTLVDQQLSGGKTDESASALHSDLERTVDAIRSYEAKRDGDLGCDSLLEGGPREDSTVSEIEEQLRILYEKRQAIHTELSKAQAQERKLSEDHNALKHSMRRKILKEAEIVVTTLSGCGGALYGVLAESVNSSQESALFDAVVVDEAAQALEPATLIPLQLLKSRGARCIMVGDPKQLPGTVISNIATKYLFHRSMFERLQRAGHPVSMLTQQYRMHPEICRFPALHFYDGKLRNGERMTSKAAAFHDTDGLGPYCFFDVSDGQESHGRNSGSLSLCNEGEADTAVEVIRFFKERYPLEFVGGRVGVITPYKSQLSLLRSRFSTALGSSILSEIEFNTVDGFQGREVDILVLSTVRAAGSGPDSPELNNRSIGFVADARRMNVALTRAKLSLWILGNARTLQTNENWASLLRDAKQRNLIREVKKPYKCIFESASPDVEGPGELKVFEMDTTCEASTDRPSGEAIEDGVKRRVVIAEPMNGVASKPEGSKSPFGCQRIGNPSNDCVPVENVKGPGRVPEPSKHEEKKPDPTSAGVTGGGRRNADEVAESLEDRKRQREAVDAILLSALIPSKRGRRQ